MSAVKPTSVWLPTDLIERLDEEAERQTRSRNNLIRVLLAEGLDRLDAARQVASAQLYDAAARISGHPDAAEREALLAEVAAASVTSGGS